VYSYPPPPFVLLPLSAAHNEPKGRPLSSAQRPGCTHTRAHTLEVQPSAAGPSPLAPRAPCLRPPSFWPAPQTSLSQERFRGPGGAVRPNGRAWISPLCAPRPLPLMCTPQARPAAAPRAGAPAPCWLCVPVATLPLLLISPCTCGPGARGAPTCAGGPRLPPSLPPSLPPLLCICRPPNPLRPQLRGARHTPQRARSCGRLNAVCPPYGSARGAHDPPQTIPVPPAGPRPCPRSRARRARRRRWPAAPRAPAPGAPAAPRAPAPGAPAAPRAPAPGAPAAAPAEKGWPWRAPLRARPGAGPRRPPLHAPLAPPPLGCPHLPPAGYWPSYQ
jgi:hypothetical protein